MNDNSQIMRYVFDIYNKTGLCQQTNTRIVPFLDRPKDYRVAVEAFVTTSSTDFGDCVKLIFETSNIPVVQSNLSANAVIQRKQIGEYHLTKSESDSKNNFISYRPAFYEEYDLDSDSPLRAMDLFVYRQDKQGVITPLLLDATGGFSLTLVFIRK